MTKQDWQAFCAVIRASDEAQGVKSRSEAALSLMFSLLGDCAIDDVRRAVLRHVQTSPYAIKPSDIRGFLEGTEADKSAAAWRTFLRALDRHGYYDSVVFPDPGYHYAVVQLGGWEKLGREWHALTERELDFRRAEWQRLYEIGLRVAGWDGEPGKVAVPRRLVGFYERNNSECGYLEHVPPVVMIGQGGALAALPEEAV